MASTKRTVLDTLGRATLHQIADGEGITLTDRRALDAAREALSRKQSLTLEAVLGYLSRDELKEACRTLGLDDGGREKDAIVSRILSADSKPAEPKRLVTPSPDPPPSAPSNGGSEGQRGKERSTVVEADVANDTENGVGDYRHDAKRKNNPPAGLAQFDRPPPRRKKDYKYDPHLDPRLEWAGKAEHTSFEVDTVSLHIHERVSTQAILRAVKRANGDAQLDLFAKPELPESKEIDFYSHDVGWSNRLILGDSLVVMNSLLERESMAGQVQCVYIDPPYGIAYSSNFQPLMSRTQVKDDDESLTREPEQVQAYRDSWELGIHSYLTYMRDRLLLAHELLATTGSVFVQISEDNVHLVRELLDEIFGRDHFVAQICYRTSVPLRSSGIPSIFDFVLWYAKDPASAKFRQLYVPREEGDKSRYTNVELPDGTRRSLSEAERKDPSLLPNGSRIWSAENLASSGYTQSCTFDFKFNGRVFKTSSGKSWKTTRDGMERLAKAGRISDSGKTIRYVLFKDDYPVQRLTNMWSDTTGEIDKAYVVQTHTKVIERCLLMASDPGDLVLDPTCGSGTTAFVAEQWGRRWITCDTSRVALALARERLLTATYPYYRLRGNRVRDGFSYEIVPHVTLGSIAQNPKIDSCKTRTEIDAVIAESAESEVLYDKPHQDKKKVRVSGPFTVEAIPLPSMEDPARDIDGPVSKAAEVAGHFSEDTTLYLSQLVDLLRQTGVNFPGNKKLRFPTLRSVKGEYEWFHAEGTSDVEGDKKRYAVSFGPRHGPVTPRQVIDAIKEAQGYDVLLFAGFACDPEARRMIDQGVHGMELVYANAAPDILVGDLLKKKKTDQIFSVFGAPDVKVHAEAEGRISVEVLGIDLYDPTSGTTESAQGDRAAGIFVDRDYDGKTFCVGQALFPGGGSNPWERLQKALKGSIDEERFDQLRTTRSLPFKAGAKVAVTVIDDRGNEVMKVVDVRKALRK